MRADALRNRQRLIEVAERLLTTKGPNTEIDEIAAAAGVGVGTFYRHFPTKEALIRTIIGAPIEELIQRIDGLAEAEDPGAAFFAVFDELVALSTEKHRLVDALTKDGASVGTPEEIRSRHRRFRAAFAVLLARAQETGAVRGGIGVSEIVALVNGAFTYLQRNGGTRAEHERLLTFIVDGLRGPKTKRRSRQRPRE